MYKISSAKYYQDNKGRLQKKLVKDMKVFVKKKNKKSNNMAKSNKSWLSIEKNITK